MLDAVIVGRVIQRFREKRNKSQELVSGFAGIGRTHLSAIERGERNPPGNLLQDCVCFGCQTKCYYGRNRKRN